MSGDGATTDNNQAAIEQAAEEFKEIEKKFAEKLVYERNLKDLKALLELLCQVDKKNTEFSNLLENIDQVQNLDGIKQYCNSIITGKEGLDKYEETPVIGAAKTVVKGIQKNISKYENIRAVTEIVNYEEYAPPAQVKFKPNIFKRILYFFRPKLREIDEAKFNATQKNSFERWKGRIVEKITNKAKEKVINNQKFQSPHKQTLDFIQLAINDPGFKVPSLLSSLQQKEESLQQKKPLPPVPLKQAAKEAATEAGKYGVLAGAVGAAALGFGLGAVAISAAGLGAIGAVMGGGLGAKYAAENLGFKMKLDELDEADDKSLNEHIKGAFDYALRSQAFDVMTNFAIQMYAMEQTGADLKSLGYGRLNEPQFKELITTLLGHLGLEMKEGENCIAKLAAMKAAEPPEEFDKIKDQFAQGKGADADEKFAKAKDLFFKELASYKLEKGHQYYGILASQVQALKQVESKQRLANLTNLLPNIDDIANYNPELRSGATHKIRELIKVNLEPIIEQAIVSVEEHKNKANELAKQGLEKMLAEVNNEPKPPVSSEKDWITANDKVKKQLEKPKKITVKKPSYDEILLGKFQENWQKEAQKLIVVLQQGGGRKLYDQIVKELEKEIEVLITNQSRKELVASAQKKLEDFKKIADPDNVNNQHLQKASLEELKGVCQAITAGLNKIALSENFENQPIDDKQLTILLKQSFEYHGSTITVPETVFAVYDELLRNDRSKLDVKSPGLIKGAITEKIGEIAAEYFSSGYQGPSIYAKYYIEQKKNGKYQLEVPPGAVKEQTQVPEIQTTVDANFTQTPTQPITAQPPQTTFQWLASKAGWETRPIQIQQSVAISSAKKLAELNGDTNTSEIKYEQAKAILEDADNIIEKLEKKAEEENKKYQLILEDFQKKLPQNKEKAKQASTAIAKNMNDVATDLGNNSINLENIDKIILDLKKKLELAEKAHKPHVEAYNQQAYLSLKTEELLKVEEPLRAAQKNYENALRLKNELESAIDVRNNEAEELRNREEEKRKADNENNEIVGDINKVVEELKKHNVESDKIDKIKGNLDQKLENKKKQYGEGWSSWIGRKTGYNTAELAALNNVETANALISQLTEVSDKRAQAKADLVQAKEKVTILGEKLETAKNAHAVCSQNFQSQMQEALKNFTHFEKSLNNKGLDYNKANEILANADKVIDDLAQRVEAAREAHQKNTDERAKLWKLNPLGEYKSDEFKKTEKALEIAEVNYNKAVELKGQLLAENSAQNEAIESYKELAKLFGSEREIKTPDENMLKEAKGKYDFLKRELERANKELKEEESKNTGWFFNNTSYNEAKKAQEEAQETFNRANTLYENLQQKISDAENYWNETGFSEENIGEWKKLAESVKQEQLTPELMAGQYQEAIENQNKALQDYENAQEEQRKLEDTISALDQDMEDIAKDWESLATKINSEHELAQKTVEAFSDPEEAYHQKCNEIAVQWNNLSAEVAAEDPYFAPPSLEKRVVDSAQKNYEEAKKLKEQLTKDIATAEILQKTAEMANNLANPSTSVPHSGVTDTAAQALIKGAVTGGIGGGFNAVMLSLATQAMGGVAGSIDPEAFQAALVRQLGKDNADRVAALYEKIYGGEQATPDDPSSWWSVAYAALSGAKAGALTAGGLAVMGGPVAMFYASITGAAWGALSSATAAALPVGFVNEALDYGLMRVAGVENTQNLYSYVKTAQEWGSPVAGLAVEITNKSLLDWGNRAKGDKSINEVIIEEGQKSLRGQTFDAFVIMLHQLHGLNEQLKNAQGNPNEIYAKMGFERLSSKDFQALRMEIIESLGLKVTDFDEIDGEIKINNKEYIKALRDKFILPPQTKEEKQSDPLGRLKFAVTKENQAVLGLIGNNKLKDSANYVCVLHSMNSIVENVDYVQKLTKAAELYMPNLNQKVGLSKEEQEKGIMDYLKENATKEVGSIAARSGVAYMIQESVTQSTGIVSNILVAANAHLAHNYAVNQIPRVDAAIQTKPPIPSKKARPSIPPHAPPVLMTHLAPHNNVRPDTPTSYVTSNEPTPPPKVEQDQKGPGGRPKA